MKTGIALLSQHVHIAAALMRSFTQGAFCSVQQPRCLSFPMHGNPLLIVREEGRRGVQNCKPHSDSVRLKCHFIISASALFPLLILSLDVSCDIYSISASPFSVFLCPSRKKDYVAHDILTLVPNFPHQIVRIKQIIYFKYFNISQFNRLGIETYFSAGISQIYVEMCSWTRTFLQCFQSALIMWNKTFQLLQLCVCV